MRKGILILVGTFLTYGLILGAEDKFLTKPFKQWKDKDVVKLLNNSPWAKQQTFASAYGVKEGGVKGDEKVEFSGDPTGSRKDRMSSGAGGEKELMDTYTVRFFTALPVREGHIRALQLATGYDSKEPQDKQKFDQMTQRALNLDTSGQIIVAVDFVSNNKQYLMDVEKRLSLLTGQQLQQSAYLISQRLGRVQIQQYFAPSPDKTGLKMVFPRTVNGQPVISPEDKEVTFEWYFDKKVLVSFPIQEMMYKGKLEF